MKSRITRSRISPPKFSSEAALPEIGATGADLQASHFDHVRDLRKHERA